LVPGAFFRSLLKTLLIKFENGDFFYGITKENIFGITKEKIFGIAEEIQKVSLPADLKVFGFFTLL